MLELLLFLSFYSKSFTSFKINSVRPFQFVILSPAWRDEGSAGCPNDIMLIRLILRFAPDTWVRGYTQDDKLERLERDSAPQRPQAPAGFIVLVFLKNRFDCGLGCAE